MTSDNKRIAADFYEADGDHFAILMHMMPATKESWQTFAEELQKIGISSLAFDQRGHGASEGGSLGYREFTDAEHQAKKLDLVAAIDELKRHGTHEEKIALIGASIGANLAIDYLGHHSSFKVGVALSPGLDYHGVTTKAAVEDLTADQSLMIVVSKEDEYSFLSSHDLKAIQPKIELIEKSGLGHGTAMFVADSQLLKNVISWLNQKL